MTVTGSLQTSVANLVFTTVTVNADHKLDVDAQEDGCVAHTALNFRVSSSGCTLKLEFGPAAGTEGGLTAVTLTADSFCPGFPDAQEGVYVSTPGYGPWWAGPTNVGQRQAASACVADAHYTFPDKAITLARADGATLTINLKDVGVSGTLVSTGNTAHHCNALTCAASHVLGPTGWCAARTWRQVSSGTNADLEGVWASDVNNAWAVGKSGNILHWNGSAWAPEAGGGTSWMQGVWGSSASDVWAVGIGKVLHRTGGTWAAVDTGGGSFSAVWGGSAGDVWLVGSVGAIRHWTGSAWTTVPSGTTSTLSAVWGSGPSDVWAAGDGGTLLHWTGSSWNTVTTPTAQDLRSVWGTGPNSVWVVGDQGVALHWNGSAWQSTPTGNPSPFFSSVTGSGTGVWAVGLSGIYTWDGAAWLEETSPVTSWLTGAWANSPSDVWAVGESGVILRSQP
jgi:hypothetical protein